MTNWPAHDSQRQGELELLLAGDLPPPICDLLLDNPFVARHRQELLTHAHGDVLEIGFGTGLNLPHYPAQSVRSPPSIRMQECTGLPRDGSKNRASRSTSGFSSGEKLPFEDNRFDCTVSTFTLCSIEAVSHAISEVYRVLKPGGQFLFLEHGLSTEPSVQKWQRRLNWLKMRLADGCHLDRNMKVLVAAQPFTSVEVEEFYLDGMPKTHGYLFRGVATK